MEAWTPTFHAWKYYLDHVYTPIKNWLTSHNLSSTIRYIVLCKGIPFKIQAVGHGGTASYNYGNCTVDGLLCMLNTNNYNSFIENSVYLHNKLNPYHYADPNFTLEHRFLPDHYVTEEYKLSYLVSHLDGISYDIVKGIIDRSLVPDTSGTATWILDNDPAFGYYFKSTKDNLESLGFNVFDDLSDNWITSYNGNVMGYSSWGTHAEDGNCNFNDSAWVKDSLHFNLSNGSVFNSCESFNGNSLTTLKWHYVFVDTNCSGHTQGLATQFTQIGGTSTLGHAFEPWTDGIIGDSIFFPAYAIGYNLVDAAYQGMKYLAHENVIVGDPLLRIGRNCQPMIITSNATLTSGDIDCNIIVPEGITLTIEHGAGVNLNRNISIKVYGNLIVENQVILNFNNYSRLKIFEGGTLTAESGASLIFNDKTLLENQGTFIFNPNSFLTLNDNSQFNSSGNLKLSPGVNITDNSNTIIKITGSLLAEGATDNYINFNFTSPNYQFLFVNGDTLKLNYCAFNSGSLTLADSIGNTELMLIENSIFSSSNKINFIGNYQIVDNLNAKLNNVLIQNFTQTGIEVRGLKTLELNNCSFSSSNASSLGIELLYNKNVFIKNSNFNLPFGINRGCKIEGNIRSLDKENIMINNCFFNLPAVEIENTAAISICNGDINVESTSIESCSISGFTNAINLNNLHNLEPYIRNNIITDFKSFGISATVGNSIRILDNNIASSTYESLDPKTGIFISDISNPILFRNTIQLSGNNEIEGAGLGLFSSNGEIRVNNISGFRNGIELGSASPNIGYNTIINNQNYGIYIGPDSYPDLSAKLSGQDRYPLSGYNTIRENGLCNPYPGYSEIYLSSSYAQLKGGCNIIADDRYEPSLQCNHNYLIDGDHVEETIGAQGNYWGEVNEHNPEGRFGENISVNFEDYLMTPCLYTKGTQFILFTNQQGEVFDTVYSDAVTPTDLTEIEIKYSEANELYYSNQFTPAKQKFSEIVQLYGNSRLSIQAYTRLLELAGLEGYSPEQFLQLRDFFIQKAGAQSDSLMTGTLTHLSNLCLVSAKEYISAINNFEEIVQQNPNTDIALYRQIDALTASSLLISDSTLGKIVAPKYKIQDINDYTRMIGDLLKTRGKTGLVSGSELIPRDYCLYQNYPNPFNPTTIIKYDLPKDGLVRLEVFDILGRRITTLVNEQRTAGSYEQIFDASTLASGVYVYKIQAVDYIDSKKMILLR